MVQGVEEASVRALSKIQQILPPRLGRRVAALQSVTVSQARGGASVDARTLTAIAAACRDFELLRFRYRDHAGAASDRSVEPHRLVHTGRRWYLVAWDAARKDWRTFRVDRIGPRVATGSRFVPRDPPARDLAAYVARGVWYAPPCRARVKLLAAAETVAHRLPEMAGLVEAVDEQSCYLEAGASTYEWLAMHLVLLGVDFEVSGPDELVEQVRRLSERYQRALGK
jgi:predicted DNA-binding transcriptional regulator YafY